MTTLAAFGQDRRMRVTKSVSSVSRWLLADRWLLAVIATSLVAAGLFAASAIARHRSYNSMAMDFAFFDQIIWNTSEGRWFETSFVPYNFNGQHVEPILLLFAALYRLTPAPEWMLVIQAVAVGAAAVALYLLTRERLRRGWLAALVAASFLLSPTLHSALVFDYHSEVMASLFVFSGLALLFRGRSRPGLALLLCTLLLKEDAALLLLGLALPLWLVSFQRQAAIVAGAGLFWIVVVVALVMPAIRGGESDLDARYAHVGSGASGIAGGILADPAGAASFASGRKQLTAIVELLLTQGGLPLAAPLVLVSALPVATLQFLSSHPPQQALRLQYGVQVLPLVMFATVEGLRRIERVRFKSELLVRLSAAALLCGIIVGVPKPELRALPDHLSAYSTGMSQQAAIEGAFRRIPDDAGVSAQSGLVAHLSQRERIWEFPVLGDAEYVILDLDGPVAKPYWSVYDDEVAALPERGYRLVWQERTVRIYQKEAP